MTMNKLPLFASLLITALWVPNASAMPKSHEARLVAGSGGKATAALQITLHDGWKTYWKMPGDAGVPPQFDWSASSNVKAVEVLYPAPKRFQDAGGETIGYKHEVVFPLLVTPGDTAKPVQLALKLDYAVCKDICIPARSELSVDLASPPASLSMAEWESRVPLPADETRIDVLGFEQRDGKIFLSVKTDEPAQDIFIDSDSLAYFGKPETAKGVNTYELPVANIKDPTKLKGKVLDIVVLGEMAAYERHVKLD